MFHVKQLIKEVEFMNILGYEIPIEIILIYVAGFFLLLFILTLWALILSIRLNQKYKRVMKDNAGNDITEAVANYYKKCTDIVDHFNQANERIVKLEKNIKACGQKIGAIRYNAFGGNNSNQSFAAAILDDSNSGFVLNGVYSRQQTTTYLKPIIEGKSMFELSEEEIEAIKTAQLNYERKMNA